MQLFPSVNNRSVNPTIVVLGQNSSRVTLAWDYTVSGGEQIGTMFIKRLNNSNSKSVTLATRFSPSSKGKVVDPFNNFTVV